MPILLVKRAANGARISRREASAASEAVGWMGWLCVRCGLGKATCPSHHNRLHARSRKPHISCTQLRAQFLSRCDAPHNDQRLSRRPTEGMPVCSVTAGKGISSFTSDSEPDVGSASEAPLSTHPAPCHHKSRCHRHPIGEYGRSAAMPATLQA